MTRPDFTTTRRALVRRTLAPLLIAAGVLATTPTGCAVNPVTGRTELALISEAQEIQIGQQSAQQVAASIGLVADTALQSYVQRIGLAQARTSERPQLPWAFAVADDPTPNAFALPGGFIFVTRGLLAVIGSEAQLASVIGHEIGHVTARHSVQMISRAQIAQLGLGLGTILLPQLEPFAGAAGLGLNLLFLSYGRDAERQADDLGFNYALEQGYDVREMPEVFATFQRMGAAGGTSPLPTWLSTHPEPGERIERIQARIAGMEEPLAGLTVERAAYLQRLAGLVYGENPRAGIFRDGVFLHPDLRFRIAFPSGWARQNLAQSVMAASPQRNAAIELTIAGTMSHSAAAQQFFQQQGIGAQQVGQQNINGLPATVGYFRATVEQGTLDGFAAFIGYEGRTYRLLGYAPTAAYASYDAAIRQSIGSFQRLTDPAVLALQPNRIQIVRLPATMTLAQFQASYPSVISIEELALINQIAGATSSLPAGTLVKRVVAAGS